jgi:ParB family chromosome partitioning protein
MSAEYQRIELSRLKPNPHNPRRSFEGKDFEDLIASIKAAGVISPILVRPIKAAKAKKTDKKKDPRKANGGFEIVAGERRWRACCRIASENGRGSPPDTIPAIVRELSDDEAFEVMVIENLQRSDITELEEAETFKKYVDRHGKDGIVHLAEKVGKEPSYVRRRIHVLKVIPKPILKAWEEGVIFFGHCEQLARLKDEKIIAKVYRAFTSKREEWFGDVQARVKLDVPSVKDLQRLINSLAVPMKGAKFDLKGCGKCSQNSQVQKELLDDVTGLREAICQDPACFKKKQAEWLKANWDECRGSAGTNGFRFLGDPGIQYSYQYSIFRDSGIKPGEKCAGCAHFVSVIHLNGKIETAQACIGDRNCFQGIVRSGQAKKEKAAKEKEKARNKTSGSGAGESGEGPHDPGEPRFDWHGQYFREKFYKEQIPCVLEGLDAEGLQFLHILLAAIFQSDHQAKKTFVQDKNIQVQRCSSASNEDLWLYISAMSIDEVRKALQKTAMEIIMRDCGDRYCSNDNFGAAGRHEIACYLGIDLQRDWRLNQGYLEAKTTKELLSLGEMLDIFQDEKAQTFVHEVLGKKRGKFTGLKKGELIRIFLESGVDLAGKVPKEILDVRTSQEKAPEPGMKVCPVCRGDCYVPSEEDPENEIYCPECGGEGQVRTCRVCGCTEKHACEGGCSWVAPDLCSACEEKSR